MAEGEGKAQGQGSAPSLYLLPQLLHLAEGPAECSCCPQGSIEVGLKLCRLLAARTGHEDGSWGRDSGEMTRVTRKARNIWDKEAGLGTNWLTLIATHCGAFLLSLEIFFEKNKFVFVYLGPLVIYMYSLTLIFHTLLLFVCGKRRWAKKLQQHCKK